MLELRNTNEAADRAPHLTITKIVRRASGEYYGFAVTDDGAGAYIPTSVCARHRLTAADVGAGFRAILQHEPSRRGAAGHAKFRVHLPVVFDAERDTTKSPSKLHNAALQAMTPEAMQDAIDEATDLGCLLAELDSLFATYDDVKENGALGMLAKKVARLRDYVDEHFPEVDDASS